MDKTRRLKVYSEKDYSELIDFPVELVGRDGVVRKYSYADSVRIYQRRIESAHVRYSDLEVINAEISHCTKRLEQLHRSWKQRMRRYEREFVRSRPVPRERELYERGKQFLRTYLERQVPGSTLASETRELNLVLLEDGPGFQVFCVNWPLFHPGTLLYAYRVARDDGAEQLAAYQRYLHLLRAVADAPDAEKLLHHEQGDDIAFILTGPRSNPLVSRRESRRFAVVHVVGALDSVLDGATGLVAAGGDRTDDADDPYRAGLEELRWKNYEEAFDLFTRALEENPFYKQAYWALGEIAYRLDHWGEAEPYLLMALKYFAEEPRAHFYHGRLLFDRGEYVQAEAAFDRAVQLNLKQARGIGFLACTRACRGRFGEAAMTLERGLDGFPEDRMLLQLAGPLHRALRHRRRVRWAAVFAVVVLVAVSTLTLSPLAWAAPLVALAGVAAFRWRGRRRLHREFLAWARSSGNLGEFEP